MPQTSENMDAGSVAIGSEAEDQGFRSEDLGGGEEGGQENHFAEEEGSGLEEGQEQPDRELRNEIAEIKRKLQESNARTQQELEYWREKALGAQNKNEETSHKFEIPPEPTPEEIAEAGHFDREEAGTIIDIVKKLIAHTVGEYQAQTATLTEEQQAHRAELIGKRNNSLIEAEEEIGSDDLGHVVIEVNGVKTMNTNSPLGKRAAEIWRASPQLQKRYDGEAKAFRMAHLELIRGKSGGSRAPSGTDRQSRATAASRKAGGSGAMTKNGQFYRKLNSAERAALPDRDTRRAYDRWESGQKLAGQLQ